MRRCTGITELRFFIIEVTFGAIFSFFHLERFIGHIDEIGFVRETVKHCCDGNFIGNNFVPAVESQTGGDCN